MDTYMQLDIWGKDADAAMGKVETMIVDLEKQWSVNDPDAVVNDLDEADHSQSALMEKLLQLSAYTGGAFDPRLGAVSRAWGFHDKQYRVPDDEELMIAIDAQQWDLGGALKGYAGAQAVQLLEQMDIDCALLSLGGNIQTYGTKADGSAWRIGIQDPHGGDPVGVVELEGTMAVVTSGDYQRYFVEDETRYHHIIDPKTGYPADSGLSSVTVICSDGLKADVLSTALFVMGLEDATAFWRQQGDFQVVFIATDGKIYATQGAALSGCEYEVIYP